MATARSALPGQRSLDDLGTPLHEVTFIVIDLETTGSSPDDDTITEIGAVRVRGGERLATFSTLVHPGRAIPAQITMITGITDALVARAPRIETVLPTLVELCEGAVVVGHNVRFDLGFLRRAFERAGWPALDHPVVDTLALSRRLFAEEVPDHRLGTLAHRLRLEHQPRHRALDDAEATVDLLHELLGRAGRLGVLGLDDLLTLPTMAGHPQAGKLRMTARLPRTAGVYLFRDRRGEVLYVGKAADLRARVRSYFSSDRRRKVAALLREVESFECLVLPGPFAPDVAELRLIQRLQPRYNRQGRRRSTCWVELTLGERWPRLMVARKRKDDGGHYIGPFSSRAQAQTVIDAIHGVSRLRRCTDRPSTRVQRAAPCAPGQLGVAFCPCAEGADAAAYRTEVDRVLRGLSGRHGLLLDPLLMHMHELAAQERFEDAAEHRDRAAALSGALDRAQRIEALRRSGTLTVVHPGGTASIEAGRLVRVVSASGVTELPEPSDDETDGLDESRLLCSLIERSTVTIGHAEHGYSLPLPRLPDLRPRQRVIGPAGRDGRR